MFLTILRHAKAADHAEYSHDEERPLVSKGLAQLERVGNLCREQQIAPQLVLSSPVLRAKQTAHAMTRLGNWPSPILETWLSCGMNPEEGLEQLRAYEQFEQVALVGHEPDLSSLVALILGCSLPAFRLRKACLVGIDLPSIRPGGGVLEFFMPCRLMPKLEKDG